MGLYIYIYTHTHTHIYIYPNKPASATLSSPQCLGSPPALFTASGFGVHELGSICFLHACSRILVVPYLMEVRERLRDVGCNNEPLRRAECHRALRVAEERCEAPAAHVLVHQAGRLLTKQTSRRRH
jgi:hypothetical protein